MARFDERDTIFSRMNLQPGTRRYRQYYSRHSDREELDRSLRCAGGGTYAERKNELRFIDSTFSLIAGMRPRVRGEIRPDRLAVEPDKISGDIRQMALALGADDFGVTSATMNLAYSVRGRGERYGRPVDSLPANCIVLAFEMDRGETMTAPDPRQSIEVVKAYLRAAVTALALAQWIRSLGWEAVAHIDGESELVFPPAAEMAGLGEIGRHGLLVSRHFGSRVRLSAVTTDLPLNTDEPVQIREGGLAAFCRRCGRCAAACPAEAIPSGDRGPINHEACFSQWKKLGTDCGICLASCPFSA